MKLFRDCSCGLAGQCRYNECLGSSICLLRSLLFATVRLIAGDVITARMYRMSMFVNRIQPVIQRQLSLRAISTLHVPTFPQTGQAYSAVE